MAPSRGTSDAVSRHVKIDKFKEILRCGGIKEEVCKIAVKDPRLKGEGMSSQMRYVKVKFVNRKVRPLNLFVKVVTSNASHRELIEELKSFEKESTFLTKYVPAAQHFCSSRGQEKLLSIYPRCYYGDDEIIVLENLVSNKGYAVLDNEEMQDVKAAKVAMKTLAKHHAISYAMLQEEGNSEKFFERFPNLDYEPYKNPYFITLMKPLLANGLISNIRILEESKINGKDAALATLKSFNGKLLEFILGIMKYDSSDKQLLVLNHGDYWNKNMMFLKKASKIVDHVIMDFQITRYNSFALDIGYYLYTSVTGATRQTHLHDLLRKYWRTLNRVTKKLGHPINLTYDQLFLEYRKKFHFGFWFFLCTSSDAGLAVLRDIDQDIKIESENEWEATFDRLIKEWIQNNPEKERKTSEELVTLLKEYHELSLS